MSKMVTPEMSVIRFKEADVIVASGAVPKTMTMATFGNTFAGDGTVTYNGTTYTINSQSSINSLFAAMAPLGVTPDTQAVYNKKGDSTNLGHLYEVEANIDGTHPTGSATSSWNATFVYGDDGVFRKQ